MPTPEALFRGDTAPVFLKYVSIGINKGGDIKTLSVICREMLDVLTLKTIDCEGKKLGSEKKGDLL